LLSSIDSLLADAKAISMPQKNKEVQLMKRI
jgi:hypothetical protein